MDSHATHIRRIYSRPWRDGSLANPGKISTCIQVGMRPETTQTFETMLDAFANTAAVGARLAGIRRIDILNFDAGGTRLVLDEGLKLPTCPAMESAAHSFPNLDAGANVRQILHRDLAGTGCEYFSDNCFARFVINVLYASRLFARDLPELLFCALATVGLKTTTEGKVSVALIAQLFAAKDLARANGREVVFTNINSYDRAKFVRYLLILALDNDIEVPVFLSKYQIRFLWDSAFDDPTLVFAKSQFRSDPSIQSVERNTIALERICSFVEMNACTFELDCGDRCSILDLVMLFHRSKSLTHRKDRIADHLRTERCGFANHSVSEVVQGDTIPAAMFNSNRNYGVACIRIGGLQLCQIGKLVWSYFKFDRGSTEHANNLNTSRLECNIPNSSYLRNVDVRKSIRYER